MININIAQLTPEQERIEFLSREASLLINKLKHRKTTRFEIEQYINNLDESDRQLFKDLLNKYKAVNV